MPIFPQRFGYVLEPTVEQDFPESARVALFSLVQDLISKDYIANSEVSSELERLARLWSATPNIKNMLANLPWQKVYIFCERLYGKLLQAVRYFDRDSEEWVERVPLQEVRSYFEAELNQLLAEENSAYEFREGLFFRPGFLHTQKELAKAQTVLGRKELASARNHFLKARRFFSALPEDFPNAVKEAVAALEAALKNLFPDLAENDFNKALARLKGVGVGQIPPTIIKGMSALYDFRGAAREVAHGGADGGLVSSEVAELVLSLVASYIVFLVSFRGSRSEGDPF
ncbi:MAG TPA: hypothetical protein VGR07_20605 [Thermoanaerobaculia bacterium]|jgi:hypothetical protein|nr:hypothetical protein [Thermoanaerobaculia bacterium]